LHPTSANKRSPRQAPAAQGNLDAVGVIRKPLDEALQAEIAGLDLLICRLWQILGLIGVLGGLCIYLALELRMGLFCSACSLVYLAWFSIEASRRKRGPLPRWLRLASVVVEGTMPWSFMLLLTYTQGAAYALGSWVPPMLFAALIVAATARLRPEVPVLISISGALTHPVLYLALVRAELPPERLAEPLFGMPLQLTRGLSLLLGGLLGGIVAARLRRAIGKADSVVRARDLFGKYRLEQRIASGGMGTVYAAVYCPEGGFERRVAVKRIHPHLAKKEGFVDAFRGEAELSARLVHPNIVQVLDFGSIDDSYFLAMELVDGITLGSFVRRLRAAEHPIEPRLVAHIGRELLAGLAFSHTGARDGDGTPLRVVHRDLCPDNILLSKHGEVKIADFGVARALRDAAASDTRTVAGHAGYMAPEQARALPLDERCDLFALGIILWELLCGRQLFHRDGDGPTLIALMSEPIPAPSSVRPLDPGWDALIGRALERDPAARTRSARVMARDLETIGDSRPTSLVAPTEELAALVALALDLPERIAAEADRQAISQLPTRVMAR
jgi:eukaryotic-like serine/threonine-protein kinase